MKISVFHLLDFILPAGVLNQINPDTSKYFPTFIILLLLMLTALVTWTSYYYWKTARNKSNRERYGIKSARLIKNGRKYWKKEKV